MEPKKESGLGLFLKGEREKKGLSLDHVAKVTRLRRYYIEALENEDWGMLPSRVFIKGFIRTYIKVIGLDYNEVIGQFESNIPVHDGLPKPLVPPQKIKNLNIFIIFFLVFIASCLIIFLLIKDPRSFFMRTEGNTPKGIKETTAQKSGNGQANKSDQLLNKDSAINNRPYDNASKMGGQPQTLPSDQKILPPDIKTTRKDVVIDTPIQTPIQAPVETKVQQTVQQEVVKPVQNTDKGNKYKYSLRGFVTQRTYIKVYVDNESPKEYMLLPGSTPQWTGKEGFYILVGNAAGIEFDFNGKRIKDLGGQGDVVRLRLPDNFNSNTYEN